MDILGQVNVLVQGSKDHWDDLPKLFVSEGRKNHALAHKREAAMARRAGSMETMTLAITDMARSRVNPDEDSPKVRQDRDDDAIITKAKKDVKSLLPGSWLHRSQTMAAESALEHMKSRQAKKCCTFKHGDAAAETEGGCGGRAKVQIKVEVRTL